MGLTCLISSTMACWVLTFNSFIRTMNICLLGHWTAAPSSNVINSFICSKPARDSILKQADDQKKKNFTKHTKNKIKSIHLVYVLVWNSRAKREPFDSILPRKAFLNSWRLCRSFLLGHYSVWDRRCFPIWRDGFVVPDRFVARQSVKLYHLRGIGSR